VIRERRSVNPQLGKLFEVSVVANCINFPLTGLPHTVGRRRLRLEGIAHAPSDLWQRAYPRFVLSAVSPM
jgi:hypothetical protein